MSCSLELVVESSVLSLRQEREYVKFECTAAYLPRLVIVDESWKEYLDLLKSSMCVVT